MTMKPLIILAGIILLMSSSAYATQLGNVKGKKVVTLQNTVGTSIAKFNSNSPLEKFEGNSQTLQGSFTLNADNLEQSIGKISFPVR